MALRDPVRGSVLIAWVVGHAVTPTVISMLVVACLASAYARTSVPSVTDPLPIPLWVLVPPMLAIFSSLGVSSALPVPRPPPTVLVVARTLWLATIVGVGAGTAGLVSAVTGFGGLVEATVLLVALTYATSTVLGRGSVVVGGAVVVVVLTYTRSFANVSGEAALLYASAAWHWAAAPVALCGCLGFPLRGASRPPG